MILEIVVIVLAVVSLAVGWQHLRYLRIRRTRAQDYQKVFHSGDVFHVITFFRLGSGDKILETVRRFVQQVTAASNARLIYAGQAAYTVNSEQLGNRDWDGVLLFEYPTRSDYGQSCDDLLCSTARSLFADSYQHAMRRNRRVSAAVPHYMLRVRLKDILSGKWQVEPFQTAPEFETFPEFEVWRARANRLKALHEVNRNGLVVFNLVKFPAAGYQGVVELLGDSLRSRMAALGYGPLHLGHTVALEKFARFDRIYILYYPSAKYFAELLSSQFFSAVIEYKEQGDALRVPTVPITDRVQHRPA